jgi:hypothetical protein
MVTLIIYLWVALAVLVLIAGLRRLLMRRRRRRGSPIVDDEAIERILAHGTLVTCEDEPLDEDEIARAEAEFWEESWDEPDDYTR